MIKKPFVLYICYQNVLLNIGCVQKILIYFKFLYHFGIFKNLINHLHLKNNSNSQTCNLFTSSINHDPAF